MSEMVERIAKAMSALAVSDGYPTRWDALGEDGREAVRSLARVAIEAMREPTEEMKQCSEEVHWGYSCHTCGGLKEGWYAMIDASLAKPSGMGINQARS